MASHPNYRAIFRFSFNSDDNSAVRNNVIKKLEDIGFKNTATGIWETKSAPIIQVSNLLNEVLDEVSHLSVDDQTLFHLDHAWFYIDKANE